MNDFKLIVTGDSQFMDYNFLLEKVNLLLSRIEPLLEIVVVVYVCDNVGMLGERFAAEFGYEVAEFSEDCPFINYFADDGICQMLNYADECICFWDGVSKETQQFIELTAGKIKTTVIKY